MSDEADKTYSPRPATPEDLAALAELERRIQVAPWTTQHFEAELAKPFSRTLVLTDEETDSEVAAYLVYWELSGEGHILNVGVALEHRGRGYAKQLIRQAIRELVRNGARKVWLELRKSNLAALALYQAVGFAVCQLRKGFYSNGEDAYVMELPLEGARVEF